MNDLKEKLIEKATQWRFPPTLDDIEKRLKFIKNVFVLHEESKKCVFVRRGLDSVGAKKALSQIRFVESVVPECLSIECSSSIKEWHVLVCIVVHENVYYVGDDSKSYPRLFYSFNIDSFFDYIIFTLAPYVHPDELQS